jgi:hypothetical protein
MTLRGCYKATVNESETIIEAQPHGGVRRRRGTGAPPALALGLVFGPGFPVSHQIERS